MLQWISVCLVLLFCMACRGALGGWAEFAASGVIKHTPAAGWQSASANKP